MSYNSHHKIISMSDNSHHVLKGRKRLYNSWFTPGLYRCGPGKRVSDDDEWKRLKSRVVQVGLDGKVTCPHCGSKNEHVNEEGHRDCDGPLRGDYCFGMMYDCPGYILAPKI